MPLDGCWRARAKGGWDGEGRRGWYEDAAWGSGRSDVLGRRERIGGRGSASVAAGKSGQLGEMGRIAGGKSLPNWLPSSSHALTQRFLSIETQKAPRPVNLGPTPSQSPSSATGVGGSASTAPLRGLGASHQNRNLSSLATSLKSRLNINKNQAITPYAGGAPSWTGSDEDEGDDETDAPLSMDLPVRWARDYVVLPLPPGAGGASALEVYRPDVREWERDVGRAEDARRDYVDQAEEDSEDVIRRQGTWGGRVLVGVVCKVSVVLFESPQGKSGQLGFFRVSRTDPPSPGGRSFER